MKKNIKAFIFIIVIAAIVVASSIALSLNGKRGEVITVNSEDIVVEKNTDNLDNSEEENAGNVEESIIDRYVTFTVGGTGDMMCHDPQLDDGKRTASILELDSKYSFDHYYDEVESFLTYPDIMIANFETNIVDNKKYIGYPDFNSPIEFAVSAKNAGIDVLSNVNNHAMDFEYEGLVKTLEALDKAGVAHTGIYSNADDYNELMFFEIDEVKVCVIGASYLQNRGALTKLTREQRKYAADIIDDYDKVVTKIKRAKSEGADLVVLSLHWGTEYEGMPDKYQKKYAEIFVAAGADLIFGHHPHVVQPAEIVTAVGDDGKKRQALVYWSLGNFISNQSRNFTNSGVIAYANYSYDTKLKKISFVDSNYIPTYVFKDRDAGFRYRILPASYFKNENDEDYPYLRDTTKKYMQDAYANTVGILGEEIVKPIDNVE